MHFCIYALSDRLADDLGIVLNPLFAVAWNVPLMPPASSDSGERDRGSWLGSGVVMTSTWLKLMVVVVVVRMAVVSNVRGVPLTISIK